MALKIFADYLKNYTQVTKIENHISKKCGVTCGVPQGSVLGSLLFSIYINDLTDVLNFCKINMFADDTSIYNSSSEPDEIEVGLNADLINIQEWLLQNKLCLNVDKTNFMMVSSPKIANKF